MKKLLSFFGFLLIIGLTSQASAITITNSDFETTPLGTAWTLNNAIVTDETVHRGTTYGPDAGNGDYYAEITGASGSYPYRGSIQQTVSWTTTDNTFTFDYRFFAEDGDVSDYAYFKINGGVEVTFYTLEDLWNNTNPKVSDWLTHTITFSGTGSGILEFGVVSYVAPTPNIDGTYKNQYSKLLIDAPSAPVPEPTTMILFGVGLLVIAGAGRRKA